MSNDPFADILRITEARSIVSGGVAAGGNWSLHLPPLGQVMFAAIVKGGCWLRLDGHREAIRLEEGDVGLLSGRDGFVMCDKLRTKPTELQRTDTWGEITKIGDGTGCTWLAGRVELDPASAVVLTQALPAVVHVRAAAAVKLRWIVEELIEEQASTLAGARIASAQLAQLFFVKILRAHLADPVATPAGWLRALSDEQLAPALRRIHDEPGRAFTLDELARAAGMSRTRFAVRFKAFAGVAPLAYVTTWRMRVAQRVLRDEDTAIRAIAESLGYASESAFSNAFKRVIGTAPSSYRVESRAT